ncbi:hypothetical protein MRX96_050324 [Rhipicephalus microplus]
MKARGGFSLMPSTSARVMDPRHASVCSYVEDSEVEPDERLAYDDHVLGYDPSTETFGEQAGWSSPRERDSDSALVLSASCTPEKKVAPQRSGPRLILATPSLLAATRTLTSPAWLSSPSDEEQPLPILLEYDGGSLPVVTEPRREPQV